MVAGRTATLLADFGVCGGKDSTLFRDGPLPLALSSRVALANEQADVDGFFGVGQACPPSDDVVATNPYDCVDAADDLGALL